MGVVEEFKAFAIKGNVVDMAVGIMIGAAFTTVVKTLVDEIIMPPLGLLTGKVDFADKFLVLRDGNPPPPYETLAAAKKAGAVTLNFGLFANAVVSFLIVSIVLFFLVRWVNRLRPPPPAPAKNKPCPFCKQDIHIDATRCSHCTAELEDRAAEA
jgi:large conductance mechanosensitive channel